MKYLYILLCPFILASCTPKDEIYFQLPEVPYATSGQAVVQRKEFVFPTVPYAN
jgi:uncharacterized lipoprotein YmbA